VPVETGKTPFERMTFFKGIINDARIESLETRKKTKLREVRVRVRVRGKTWGSELSSIVLQRFKVYFSVPYWSKIYKS